MTRKERTTKRKATRIRDKEEAKEDRDDLHILMLDLVARYGQKGALERAVGCLLAVHSLVGEELQKTIMDYMVGDNEDPAS